MCLLVYLKFHPGLLLVLVRLHHPFPHPPSPQDLLICTMELFRTCVDIPQSSD